MFFLLKKNRRRIKKKLKHHILVWVQSTKRGREKKKFRQLGRKLKKIIVYQNNFH